ncbi:MAG: protein-L-isoaspartate O-methyltransferase [Marinicellaceae bacterium]
MNFNIARQNMLLNQIRTWDFISPENINLMRQVQREEFVPVEHRKLAFSDIEIPMAHNEAMMKPIVEGRILQSLEFKGHENILEVGTGSSYLTALMALSVKTVTTLDIHQDFTDSAKEKLQEADINNVECICQDIYKYDSTTQYDSIVITGSMTEVPEFLLKNINQDGKIFVILGESPVMSASIVSLNENSEPIIETLFETDVKALVKPTNNSIFNL